MLLISGSQELVLYSGADIIQAREAATKTIS